MKRIFSVKEIAAAAGVSRPTVTRYSHIYGIKPDIQVSEHRFAFSHEQAMRLAEEIKNQNQDGSEILRKSFMERSSEDMPAAMAG